MAIKKVIVNYEEETSEIISAIRRELDQVRSLDDNYFLKLRETCNLKMKEDWQYNLKFRRKNIFSFPPPPPQITDLHFFRGPFKAKEVSLNIALEWVVKFLDENLLLSQTEPVIIDIIEHPWGRMGGGGLIQASQFVRWFCNYLEAPKRFEWTKLFNYGFQEEDALWLYKDAVYLARGNYSHDEKKLLILEYVKKEQRKFERLKNSLSEKETEEIKYERTRISEEVRIAVWRRDQGKCARCGSRVNLEYDHIVPVSKGGGNTERNIELLCQDCNRFKSNRIE